jgi:hypothetical protein
MSASNETTLTTIQAAFSADLKKNWGWLLALGLVSSSWEPSGSI